MERSLFDRKELERSPPSVGDADSAQPGRHPVSADDQAIVEYLESCAIHQLGHVHGGLLEHLQGTCALLRAWGNPPGLCHAGLCHAVYGTDGYPLTLLDVTTDRGLLGDRIGREAEALVYLYASCDRAQVYPQVRAASAMLFRDRFTGGISTPSPSMLAAFMELTFANELDIIGKDPRLAAPAEPLLGTMFRRCKPLVSEPAYACFLQLFGESDGGQQ